MQEPVVFDGWSFVSDNPYWRHHGETLKVLHRNAIDSSYYDCLATDGTYPAVSTNHLREMYRTGQMIAPKE